MLVQLSQVDYCLSVVTFQIFDFPESADRIRATLDRMQVVKVNSTKCVLLGRFVNKNGRLGL